MEKKIVESHRDLLHAILVIGTMVIFFGLLGTFIIFYIAAQYELPKSIFLTLLGLGAYSFAILSLRHYFNDVPKIIISTTAITIKTLFNKRVIPLADIENVGLNQKSPMAIVYLAVDMESTIIHSKQFGEIILWDHYYKNINQLKFILERIADKVRNGDLNFDELANLKPKPKAIVNKINPNDLRLENFKEYKGNIFLNFNSLMFFSILTITIVYFDINRIGAFLAINALLYGLMGYQSNYFLLSDNYLQVRNYLCFGKRQPIDSRTFMK